MSPDYRNWAGGDRVPSARRHARRRRFGSPQSVSTIRFRTSNVFSRWHETSRMSRPHKILVVEEEPLVLEATALALTRAGYTVEATQDVFCLPLRVGRFR